MIKNPPLVLDTGIISRYGFTKRFDILKSLYGGHIIVPTEVIMECTRIPQLETEVKTALEDRWLRERTITYNENPAIVKEFGSLRRKYDPGESAVLAIAKHENLTVGSDDMRATKRFCQTNNLQLIGSLGVLFDAHLNQLINSTEANTLLNEMIIKSHYRCPVTQFIDVYNWFKYGIGRELF